jgi:hypothetical protein
MKKINAMLVHFYIHLHLQRIYFHCATNFIKISRNIIFKTVYFKMPVARNIFTNEIANLMALMDSFDVQRLKGHLHTIEKKLRIFSPSNFTTQPLMPFLSLLPIC